MTTPENCQPSGSESMLVWGPLPAGVWECPSEDPRVSEALSLAERVCICRIRTGSFFPRRRSVLFRLPPCPPKRRPGPHFSRMLSHFSAIKFLASAPGPRRIFLSFCSGDQLTPLTPYNLPVHQIPLLGCLSICPQATLSVASQHRFFVPVSGPQKFATASAALILSAQTLAFVPCWGQNVSFSVACFAI